jgi:RNA polymerase sigma-70 factor (ECF subfamily)
MGSGRQAASTNFLGKSDISKTPFVIENSTLERYLAELRRHARALMRRSTDAEDLAQDCMLRALGHIDDIADLRAYLFQTLRHAYADRVSTMMRDAAAIALEDARTQLVDTRSPYLRLEIRDVARQVAKLPRQQREVILLIAGAGATYDEAALYLKVPVGTVMSRLSRARKTLRDGRATDRQFSA